MTRTALVSQLISCAETKTPIRMKLLSGKVMDVTPFSAMSEIVFFDVHENSRKQVEGLEEIGFEYQEIDSFEVLKQ